MRLFALTAAALVLASPTFAATATGTAIATVLQPISVTNTVPLSLGSLNPPASGSVTVTVNPDGTFSGPIIGTPTPATFQVSGSAGSAVTFSVDPTVVLDGPNSQHITATTINGSPSGGTLNSFGVMLAKVGATFSLPSTAFPGSYSGTFNVTANYQ